MPISTLDRPFSGLNERPLYGQFIRSMASVSSEDLDSCLEQQQKAGGRLGDILCERGLIDTYHRQEALREQARWVARALQGDIAPTVLPYPARLSLCMPAFNEGENLDSTLECALICLPEFVEDFEIIVVDDGSKDNTADVVQRWANDDQRVRLVSHKVNRGYGAAVTTGLRAATGDLVMFTDSDGQFSLLDLPVFLGEIANHDLVIGYRFDRAERGLRRVNAWAWTRLIRFMLGVQVRDLDCAFKLFRRETLDQLQLSATGAAINAEIMTQCFERQFQIRELPVAHFPCYFGTQTGANLRVIIRAFKELRALKRNGKSPSASSTADNNIEQASSSSVA